MTRGAFVALALERPAAHARVLSAAPVVSMVTP